MNRFLCLSLYLIFITMNFFRIPVHIERNKTGFLIVDAFTIHKTTFRNQRSDLNGKVRRSRFSSRANPCISNYVSDATTFSRQRPLMGHRIAVVGGGLAGLSTAYHLLEKSLSSDITIFDRQCPGAGGASAVAGG